MEVVRLRAPGTQHRGTERRLLDGPRRRRRSRVALGTFDGVHLGHRRVISGCDTVLTFDPHPMQVLAPQQAPKMLADQRLKMQRLEALGVTRMAVVPFDAVWAELAPHEFVAEVLIASLGARSVSVGEGFRFGAGGAGTSETFTEFPPLQTRVVPLVSHHRTGLPISSTWIRDLVARGKVELAGELLGAPFAVPAIVRGGGRLVIASGFARPAAGTYRGYLDSEPCSIHVEDDLTIAITDDDRTGEHVQALFTTRIA